MNRTLFVSFVVLVLGAGAAGCGYSSPTAPYANGAYPTGSYAATVITSTDGAVTTDRIGAGGSLSLTLNADLTTAGALVDGGETFDMAGRWTFDGTTVRITQDAVTFVRDMRFVVTGTSLVGDGTFDGEQFHAVLVPKAGDAAR